MIEITIVKISPVSIKLSIDFVYLYIVLTEMNYWNFRDLETRIGGKGGQPVDLNFRCKNHYKLWKDCLDFKRKIRNSATQSNIVTDFHSKEYGLVVSYFPCLK